MAAHDFWRVSFLDSQGGGYPACADIQFRPVAGVSVTPSGGVPTVSSAVFGQPAINAFDGNPNTGVVLGGGSGWMEYAYAEGTGPAAVQLMLQADKTYFANEGPKNITVDYSDDGAAWTTVAAINCGGAWAADEIRLFDITPPPPPGMKASTGRVLSVVSLATPVIRASAGRVLAIYNFPSASMRVSQSRQISVVKRASPIEVSQARVLAIVKGRVGNPRVRAWTFTLDGHDFYVLRLGDDETLVYDTTSQQWVNWDSLQSGAWRPNIGTTWVGAQRRGWQFGSNIVAGDDTFGLLWFLDPKGAFDQNPNADRGKQQIPFMRIVTGQVLAKGREAVPCYVLFVDGDNYGITATDFTPGAQLETSDDQGRNFDDQGTLTVAPPEPIDNYYEWLSLGQITSPGRIFRLTDNGIFQRIDSMEMNDNAG